MKAWMMVKKIMRRLGIFLLALLLIANLIILVTGKFYLYKAVWYTYLHGQSGPGIYDQDYFYSREIPAVVKPDYWKSYHENEKAKFIIDEKLLEQIESFQTTSFLIIHQDKILFEKYWLEHDQDKLSNSFSMAKSITAMCIGIAIGEGKIKNLDQKVCDFIPEFKDGNRKELTIRHLLSMSAALDWSESGGNPFSDNAEAYYGWDLKGMINAIELAGTPGETFVYQSGATMILGYIIEKATGKKLADYAAEKIWKHVGAEHESFWSLDHENGLEKAYCCFYATTRDFARIGRIMMNGGIWKSMNFGESHDVQILPESFVKESIIPADLMKENGDKNDCYGLSWWILKYNHGKIPIDVFYARGILGQYIICVPYLNLIIVRTGHKRGDKKEGNDHPSDVFVYLDFAAKLLQRP